MVRHANEDSYYVDEEMAIYAVADGVGGGRAGDVASRVFCDVVREHRESFRAVLSQPLQSTENRNHAMVVMSKLFNVASERIFRLSEGDAKYRGMSTTGLVMAMGGGGAMLGHVGDSRAYLIEKDEARRLTVDHTLAQELIQQGLLAEDEYETFQYRNVLARAIGQFPSVRVDTLWLDLSFGDNVLLATDGLYKHLCKDDCPMLLDNGVEWAIELANQRKGDDNLTGVLVQLPQAKTAEKRLDTTEKAHLLSTLKLFQYLNYQELLMVLNSVVEVQYSKGQAIFREGQGGDALYMVFSGEVAVQKNGKELTRIGTGGHFGEIAFMDGGTRSADILTVEDTSLLAVQRDEFLTLIRKNPQIAAKILWTFTLNLADRLRSLSADVVTQTEQATRP